MEASTRDQTGVRGHRHTVATCLQLCRVDSFESGHTVDGD